nr:uncharacterized protein LOC112080610 isoform X2 [Salvelinus alpinus]
MSKIQLLRGFLNQRLTAAAEEIFEVVEQTIAQYQEEFVRTKEENDRLQKLLDIVIKPEIKLHRTDLPCTPPLPLTASSRSACTRLIKTGSSLNTSPEKLLQTPQLCQWLTVGSDTVSVPVTALPPAVVNPPSLSTQDVPLTKDERIVLGILEKQQQQLAGPQQEQCQQQKQKQTKTCISCGQAKSQYRKNGSSVHFFYQRGQVRYFYCSTKVFQIYGAEGLTNPKMSFDDFASTEFFQRELKATKERVAQKKPKTKSADLQPSRNMCRFCHLQMKQGPNSPHIHTGFPGVTGKYVYCPAKVFSMYQSQGMEHNILFLSHTHTLAPMYINCNTLFILCMLHFI